MLRDSSPPVPPSARAMLALFAVIALLWFGYLGSARPLAADEARHAEIAREMAASGDWLRPRLNGSVTFADPPLAYWASAAAFRVFGESEWTARLWSALTGFAGVALAFVTAGRLWGLRCGIIAAGVLASSLLWATAGRMSWLDAGSAFFLQLALSGLLLANRDAQGDRVRRNWMLLAWAGLGLAVLSLGVPALLLAPAMLLAYGIAGRDLRPWARLHLGSGLPLLLLIALPWFLAVWVLEPGLRETLVDAQLLRRGQAAATGLRTNLLVALLLATLPWSLVIAHGALSAWRAGRWPDFQPGRLLLSWCLVCVACALGSGLPGPRLILAALPATALLAAFWLHRAGSRGQRRHFLIVAGLAAVSVPFLLRLDSLPQVLTASGPQWLAAAAAILAAAALAAATLAGKGHTLIAPMLLAIGSLSAASVLLTGDEQSGNSRSTPDLAARIAPLLPPDVPFFSIGIDAADLGFYLRRSITPVAGRGDPAPPDLAAFAERWRAAPEAFALMSPATHAALTTTGLPLQLVVAEPRRIVVRKPPSRP